MITLVSGYVYQCLTFCPLSNHASIIFVHRREVQQRARSEETIKQYLPTNGSMGVEQAVSFVSVLDRIEVYALNKVRAYRFTKVQEWLAQCLGDFMGTESVGLSCMHRKGSAQIGGKELCSLEFL